MVYNICTLNKTHVLGVVVTLLYQWRGKGLEAGILSLKNFMILKPYHDSKKIITVLLSFKVYVNFLVSDQNCLDLRPLLDLNRWSPDVYCCHDVTKIYLTCETSFLENQ